MFFYTSRQIDIIDVAVIGYNAKECLESKC